MLGKHGYRKSKYGCSLWTYDWNDPSDYEKSHGSNRPGNQNGQIKLKKVRNNWWINVEKLRLGWPGRLRRLQNRIKKIKVSCQLTGVNWV